MPRPPRDSLPFGTPRLNYGIVPIIIPAHPKTCGDIVVQCAGGVGGQGRGWGEALALCFVSVASMRPKLKLTKEHA